MRALLILALLSLGSLAPAETVLERPEITIGFEDDSTNLLVTASWKDERGKVMRETFSLGKDLHIIFEKQGDEWVKTNQDFASKNWEAFLLPDASGFLLMERVYDGTGFENVSLQVFEYFPIHRQRALRLANGSPYWSEDGKELALVEVVNGRFNVVIYDILRGTVLTKKSGLNESDGKNLIGDFKRARVCDDELPCESAPTLKRDVRKPKKRR